ncbi:MAG: serpin family protein, partial [Gemmatimonadaceae bacterium]|nr:serpin family protein [Gloeobacterales cyanobacterium ES-bin-141]
MKTLIYTISIFIIGCLGPFLSFAGAQEPHTIDKRVVSANTGFGFKLFEEIIKREGNKNIFVSPASAALALSMVYNGADGDTRQAMASALNLQGLTLEEVNRSNASLKESLENLDPQVGLSIANSLWARQGLALRPEFVQRNKDFYNAEVSILNFTNPAAPDRINQWVNDKTQGRITKIIDTVKAEDALLLINAVYFKGSWQKKFDQAREGTFTLTDGRQKKHPMMSQMGQYRYFEYEKFLAVRLPFCQGRVSMLVFLPGTDSSLEVFQRGLTARIWEL